MIAAAIGAVLVTGTTSALAAGTGHVPAGTSWGYQSGAPRTNSTTSPTAVAYGDSVAHESIGAISAAVGGRVNVVYHMAGGTGICDWFTQMQRDAATHPALAVLEFGGDFPRACDHTATRSDEFRDDAIIAARAFQAAGTQVVLINGPQGSPSGMAPNYGDSSIDAAYQQAAASVSGTTVDTAPAAAVAPGHRFTQFLPCLAGETAAMGCIPAYGGVIKVRAVDGVHLCPSGYPGDYGTCPTYSSGEVRYGRAVAAEILAKA